MKNRIVNAAIQLVPLANRNIAFPIIDNVISVIQKSGLIYEVGSFETNIEGTYEDVLALFDKVCATAADSNNEFLVYLKLHLHPKQNLSSKEKLAKFR